MTTYNHTPIATGAAANAATINTPMGALDAAVGSLAALAAKTKTSVVAAVNDAVRANRAGAAYHARGGVTWNAATKVFTVTQPSYILHGTGGNFLSFTADIVIDFSGTAANQIVYVYVVGVDPTTTQSGYSLSNVKTETYVGLTRNLWDPDVYVLATYTQSDNKLTSSFFANGEVADNRAGRGALIYENRGGISWNPATKILTLLPNTYIYPGRDGIFLSFKTTVTLDFSTFSTNYAAFAYVGGVNVNAVQDSYSTSNIKIESIYDLTRNLNDPDIYVLATYMENGNRIMSPFFQDGAPPVAQPWRNLYPNVYAKLPRTVGRLMNPTSEVKVLLWGDSILARDEYTSSSGLTPASLPPLLISKNIAWHLWNALPMRKGVYKRYDTASYFTETGTWATSLDGNNTAAGGANTSWDDAGDRSAYTRISDASTAAVQWTLGTASGESGCNLIYRTDTAGDAAATITVTQGANYIEMWNGSAWVEANGATFSMRETDDGARRGNTVYNKRLKLRKKVGHLNDSATIKISKATADSDRLLYWGVELHDAKYGRLICQLVNSARGAHTLAQLYDYMDDDVIDQAPDLVILEIPLINEIAASGATKASICNWVQDVVWGDRSGNTNTWNLKTQSAAWANFEVLLVIPHYVQSYFASNDTWAEPVAYTTAQEIYNAVKALIRSKNDVAMIDLSAAMLREIDASAMYGGQYYKALAASSAAGLTYMTDGTHPNDRGALVYASHLCPVLDFNTV